MKMDGDTLKALNKRLHGGHANRSNAYCMIDITDHNGISKYGSTKAYIDIIGGIMLDVQASFVSGTNGMVSVSMTCVRNVDGKKLNNEFSTDALTGVVEMFDEIRLLTQNSVYILRRVNG